MASGEQDVLRLRNEEHSRLLFEEATDGVFISSAEGVYLAVNRSGHRILGYDAVELVGKAISLVLAEAELPRLRAALSAVASGNIQTEVWSFLRKDRSLVPCEVLAQRLSNGAFMAVVRALDARGEFERKIRASEAKLGSILRTAPDVILTVDREGRISFINRTLPPLAVEQVIGTSCYDYVPAEARARVQQAIERVFTTREIDEYEVESPPGPDGQRGWSSVRAGPQIEGDRVVAVTLCATDISERKRESARLQELLERLRQIASLVPGVVYQYQLRPDGSACFPYASERIREVLRLSPEAVRQDAAAFFDTIHPDDRPGVLASLRRSAERLQPWHREFRLLFPGEDLRWLSGDSVPERQKDGSTLWHGFLSDVTDRKLAELARGKLEEQLLQAQKMESVGQLAGGVAHDFNNLLTTIIAFTEIAQEEPAPSANLTECLDGIKASASRGGALTQQLLAFARKKIVKPEDADLSAVLGRMAPMIRRLVGEHIEVVLALARDLQAVRVDVGSIEQVIMNLIVNARDAMPRGGKLTLETAAMELDERIQPPHPELAAGSYVVLSVTDSGTGIAPDIRARLFEPFFTTKPQGSGTGLGLAMCHGIVKQAGGSIAVESELGTGTAFHIFLPRSPRTGQPREAAPVRPPRASTGHETLLMVEDEPMILRVARVALERLGYRVLTAGDGAEALAAAARGSEHIDLLITDIVMPGIGGKELAERIQQINPAIKVLYTSGYAENAIAHQGVLIEGVNFIEKPYALAGLARRVREVLDGT